MTQTTIYYELSQAQSHTEPPLWSWTSTIDGTNYCVKFSDSGKIYVDRCD